MYTSIAVDISKLDAYGLLPGLLIDHATGDNIRWSTDAYASLHKYGYGVEDQIEPLVLLSMEDDIVRIRAEKEQDLKADRTKQRAEVFTPRWICSYMIDELDLPWLKENGIEIEDAVVDERTTAEENVACSTGTEKAADVSSESLDDWYPPVFEDDDAEDEDRTEADSTVADLSKVEADDRGLSEDYESRIDFSKIDMETKGLWKKYVSLRKLEITCGEAPYIVTRYDAATGEPVDIEERTGMLDRKLIIIGRYAKDETEWFKYAKKALKTTYGYEYQGDNLLVARINVVVSVGEFFEDRWGHDLDQKQYKQVIEIVSWNLWQMNGLTGMTPCGALGSETIFAESLFFDEISGDDDETVESSPCKVKLWSGKKESEDVIEFRNIGANDGLEEGEGLKMKFDYVIGNPPYQVDTKDTSDNPIYHTFMDACETISDSVTLITPGRFLFEAGKTPDAWNRKKLNDPHFKVCYYEQDSSKVFGGTSIKGGVAITHYDATKEYEPIRTFSIYPELNTILHKVLASEGFEGIQSIIYLQNKFDLDAVYKDFPKLKDKIGSGGKESRLTTSIFTTVPELFSDNKDAIHDIGIWGIINNNVRSLKYISRRYLRPHECLDVFTIIVPKSNGSGALGEVLSTPLIGEPLIGVTQSFITFGAFVAKTEAQAAYKYIQSKFARAMLGILKITQDNPKSTWKYVPLQDFTSSSDIDWTKSIHEIDQQLYKKYGLSQKEIDFIEEKVRSMEDE